ADPWIIEGTRPDPSDVYGNDGRTDRASCGVPDRRSEPGCHSEGTVRIRAEEIPERPGPVRIASDPHRRYAGSVAGVHHRARSADRSGGRTFDDRGRL